jgi:hypothetical protein
MTDIEDSRKRVPCPVCGEAILPAANRCRYCGEEFDTVTGPYGTGKPTAGKYSAEELRRIAVLQRAIVLAVLANILAYPALAVLPKTGLVIEIAVSIFQLVCIAKLASALRHRFVWLWVIGALIPCVSLIVLVAINSNATSALQLSGVRVGLLGARFRDLDEGA